MRRLKIKNVEWLEKFYLRGKKRRRERFLCLEQMNNIRGFKMAEELCKELKGRGAFRGMADKTRKWKMRKRSGGQKGEKKEKQRGFHLKGLI